MFNGFPSTVTPAVQVWDFSFTFASTGATRSVSLADDCAPIQYFRTGATSTVIRVNLPLAAPDGKIIKIINHSARLVNQTLNIYLTDVSDENYYIIGPGQTIDFCYSKLCLTLGSNAASSTGWICLNQVSFNSTGYNAVNLGGSSNATYGVNSASVGGNASLASGSGSGVFAGSANTASGQNGVVVGGSSNSASNTYTFVGGGLSNAANAFASAVVGGYWGTARSVEGRIVFPASANPITLAAGVAQTSILVVGKQTTNATATVLVSNQSAVGSGNQLVLPNNSAYYVRGSVIANVTAGGDTKAWTFEAVIKRGAGVGTTALVAAVVPTVTAADTGAAAWTIAVSADTTYGALSVSVTGAAATTIRWVCKLESTEVAF
jgi:hypothetical protein